MAAKTNELTHTQREALKSAIVKGEVVNYPGEFYATSINKPMLQTLRDKGMIRITDKFHSRRLALTTKGREYAIAKGWLAAPTEAQQAAPVASADSGDGTQDKRTNSESVKPVKKTSKEIVKETTAAMNAAMLEISKPSNQRAMDKTQYAAEGIASATMTGLAMRGLIVAVEVTGTIMWVRFTDKGNALLKRLNKPTPAAQPTSAQAGGDAVSDDKPKISGGDFVIYNGDAYTVTHANDDSRYSDMPTYRISTGYGLVAGTFTAEQLTPATVISTAELDALKAELATARAALNEGARLTQAAMLRTASGLTRGILSEALGVLRTAAKREDTVAN